MIKSRTATLNSGNAEVSLTLSYIVLWTGEDYEVTVFDQEPPDNQTPEYIERFTVEHPRYAEPRMDAILRRTLKEQIDQYICISCE